MKTTLRAPSPRLTAMLYGGVVALAVVPMSQGAARLPLTLLLLLPILGAAAYFDHVIGRIMAGTLALGTLAAAPLGGDAPLVGALVTAALIVAVGELLPRLISAQSLSAALLKTRYEQQLRFEELVMTICTRFVELPADEVEREIYRALRAVCEFAGLDRGYVALLESGGSALRTVYTWSGPGVEDHPDQARALPVARLPWWMARLEASDSIYVPEVAALPDEASAERRLLERREVHSIVAVPIRHRQTLRGCLAFDATHGRLEWSEEQIAPLRILGEIFIAAIEWQRAEQGLAEQRLFAEQIMSSMGQGLAVTATDGQLEYVNPAFATLVGLPAASLTGRRLDEFLSEPPPCTGCEQQFEGELRRGDGSSATVLVTMVPDRAEVELPGTIFVLTDLSTRKALEESLAAARDQAIAVSQLKSDFLATVSHEIRTPMNAIIGMNELLLKSELDESQRSLAEIVGSAAEGLLEIIDDLLDFSKIEAGKLELECIEFDLTAVVEEAAEMLAARAREKRIGLMSFVSPEIHRPLGGDPGRLRQVLVNLISNAVKFTDDGEVIVRARPVARDESAHTIEIEVSDTGIGIPDEVMPRLFTPFMQGSSTTTRQYGGSGLGLAISRHLVERMGGTIEVESTPGVGSTFRFTVQLEPRYPQRVPTPMLPALRGARLLVIEDSQSHLQILLRTLAGWGLEVEGATTGHEALERMGAAALEGASFDLLLADLNLPDMDGFALARALERRGETGAPPILLMTAFDERGQRLQALEAGFVGYLTKPIRQRALADALAEALLGRGRRRSDTTARVLEPHQETRGRGHRILLAEDNPINQQVALRQLHELGYAVSLVANGQEALDRLSREAERFDLLLIDCHMPVLDGFATTRAIRRAEEGNGRRLPIVAMTASAMAGDREACLEAGMDDYISKPVHLDGLRTTLARWLSHEEGAARGAQPEPTGSNRPLLRLIGASLDVEMLEEFFDENESEEFVALTQLFLEDAERHIETVLAPPEERKDEEYRRAIHTLKGNAATFGASDLAALCLRLETLIASGQPDEAAKLGVEVAREFQRVRIAIGALQSHLRRRAAAHDPPATAAP